MRLAAALLVGLLAATPAWAQAPALTPALHGLGFLVGRWSTPARGRVADTGGASAGEVSFTPEAGGAVLLRRDHVRLYTAAGAPRGAFDILMMIYPEAGAIRADYADGDHVIHYTSATVVAGRSAIFLSTPSSTAPTFRLSYVLTGPGVVAVAFSVAPPGQTTFRAIATGEIVEDR